MGAASTGAGEFCRELVAQSRRLAPVEATDFCNRATGYVCSIPERDMASVTVRTTRKLGAHTRASANESSAPRCGNRGQQENRRGLVSVQEELIILAEKFRTCAEARRRSFTFKAIHRWSTEHCEREGQPLQPTLTSVTRSVDCGEPSPCAIVQLHVSPERAPLANFIVPEIATRHARRREETVIVVPAIHASAGKLVDAVLAYDSRRSVDGSAFSREILNFRILL